MNTKPLPSFKTCLWRAARVKLLVFLFVLIFAAYWFGSFDLPGGYTWGMGMNYLPGPHTKWH